MPDLSAGLGIKAYQRTGVQIGSWPRASVGIIGRIFDIEIDVTEFGIDGEGSPDAGVAGEIRPTQPGFRSGLTGAWNGVEDPRLFARTNIEGHDIALDVFLVRPSARPQCWTDDHHIAGNDGRRTVADMADRIALEI